MLDDANQGSRAQPVTVASPSSLFGREGGLGGDGVQLAEMMDMRSTKDMSFQIRRENNAGNCALNV